MPIYEYQCIACQHEFEIMHKISEQPGINCPLCQNSVQQLISASNFKLKGTGWYVTDFRDKNANQAKDEPKKDKPAETSVKSSKSAKSTDNKSAGSSKGTTTTTETS